MADIKGITIQFEGDTVSIDRSIKSLNQSLKGLKSEFKKLDKNFKLDPKNLENIDKILENIENQQKAVNEKLKIYKDELNDLNAKGKFGSDQWLRINAEIKKAEETLQSLNSKAKYFNSLTLKDINKQFKEVGNSIKSVGSKVESAGNKVKGASTVMTAGLVASATSAIQFEEAFTGVAKTVDATDEQLDELKKGIRELALEIPASTTEISAVAEAAGQLGIKTEDILKFSETMIGLGNATNLTSDEASTMIAQFANVNDIKGEYEQFASTLVELGNNGASTEKDIMELAQRLAGAGAMAGLSAQEILGLSASMANVGINAEAGGTSMSTFISKLEASVAKGGESLNAFAQVSGMSAQEFIETWQTEPAKAIDSFISGLANIESSGESAIVTLQDLGISETRQRDMLLRLANAQGEVSKNVELANNAWSANVALANETEKKYSTNLSQLKLLGNQLKDIGMQLGEVLLPAIIPVVQAVTNFLKGLNDINPVILQVITGIMAFIAALAPVLIIIGKVITAVGTITTFLGSTGLIGVLTTLGTTLMSLLNPITAVIGVFVALYASSETFRNGVHKLGQEIITFFKNALETMGVVIENIKEGLLKAFDQINEKIQSVIEWFKSLFGWIGSVADKVSGFFSSWGDKISGIGEWVGGLFSSGGYSSGGIGDISLTTNINVNTNREITSLDTRRWALQMVDVLNEELGALV